MSDDLVGTYSIPAGDRFSLRNENPGTMSVCITTGDGTRVWLKLLAGDMATILPGSGPITYQIESYEAGCIAPID